ncbi:MAG: MFS transporter [Bacteroidales bacterium]|nr:MFS transporter [Bacteroidales bacterium]
MIKKYGFALYNYSLISYTFTAFYIFAKKVANVKAYSKNISLLYLIKIAKWFMLYMPIIVLFYQENGLSLRDVLTLQAIYSIAIIVLEIPSGYLADVWGRKNTIILGAILGTLGFAVYSFSYGFFGFLIAELILGMGQSFISGSDSALLYDSLKQNNQEKHYVKYEGRILSIGNFAETIAAVAGGFLAEISLRTPFYWQTAIAFIAIPAAIMLTEPYRIRQNKSKVLTQILSIVKLSLFKSRQLSVNIFFSSIIGCATLTMAWFIQAYLKDVQNFSEYQIGIAWSVLNLSVGVATIFAYKIEKKLGRILTLLLILLVISGSYIFIGLTELKIVFLIIWLFYIARGIATPVLKDYINRLCKPEVRATVLSIRNFTIRIFFAGFGPMVGWIADLYTLQTAFIITGITISISGVILFIIYIPFLLDKSS